MTTNLIIAILLTMTILIIALVFYFNIRVMIYITIFAIFFPIHIPFMGRDALTTGTVIIFLLFLKYFIESLKERNFIKEKLDLWIYLLIICGGISVFFPIFTGVFEKEQIGHVVRLYFAFFASMLFFLVIKNYGQTVIQFNSGFNTNYIEKVLSIFLILVSVHILISISIKYFPSLGSVFKIFYPRNIEVLEFTRGGRVEIARVSSFVFTPEQYGEFLAMLSPIVLYKIYKFRNLFWGFCFLLFSIGLISVVTRSGIILFVAGVIFSLLYHARHKFFKTVVLTYVLLSILGMVLYFKPSIFGDVFMRFEDTSDRYTSGMSMFDVINRSRMPGNFAIAISNLSLFGKGEAEWHFHNLFLTTLHTKGIIGAILFFTVFFYPIACLMKAFTGNKAVNRTLVFACLLSMGLFLVNEMKYEFTRMASYQQICWGILGTYYLISKNAVVNRDK